MNLRSVGGEGRKRGNVRQVPADLGDDARTFPIRRIDSYGLDPNQDFIITRHRDRHLLNQRGTILSSDRHQSLRLRRASGGDLRVG
jgi:hypothetical protein